MKIAIFGFFCLEAVLALPPPIPAYPLNPLQPSYPEYPLNPLQPSYPEYPLNPLRPSYPEYPLNPLQPSYPEYPLNPLPPSYPCWGSDYCNFGPVCLKNCMARSIFFRGFRSKIIFSCNCSVAVSKFSGLRQ